MSIRVKMVRGSLTILSSRIYVGHASFPGADPGFLKGGGGPD